MVGANGKEHVDAYPLAWPSGWRRTSAHLRSRARFHKLERVASQTPGSYYERKSDLTIAGAIDRLAKALQAIGAWTTETVISTNLELRNDGLPRSGQRAPDDPGASVYWRKGKETRCMAIDRYDRVQDNLAAIAATLEAMRLIDRHGGAEILDRAFTGFVALPQPEQWWQVLGVHSRATRNEIDAAYRALAMKHHPDRGGSDHEMARVNAARDQGYQTERA
jgi:hypothetical protein